MTNEMSNVPELRFPEFDGEWEEKQLSAILEIGTGKSKVQSNESGKYNILGSTGIIGKSHTYDYEGDFILTARVGHYAGKLYKHAGKVNISDNTIYLFNFINKNFIYESLNVFKLEKLVFGSGQPLIKASDLKKLKIRVPVSKEQKKIGVFFSKLDRQIELEEQKLEKLEEQKKGYMQKIFSQELRFKDENGQEYPAWINKKLGDIGKVSMNKRIYKNETSINGEIPFYKIGTFGKEAETFISREKFEEYKNKYPYPEKGDILISASGSIGRTIEYDGEEAYYQDSNIVWLDHNDEVLNIFLKYIYSVIKWSGIEGTTIKRLYNKDILNTKIDLPVIKEQEKIGNFFGKIDDSIEKQSSKIGVLKQRKKGFLQKMFV